MKNIKFNLTMYKELADVVKNGVDIKSSVAEGLKEDSIIRDIKNILKDNYGKKDCILNADFSPYVVYDESSFRVDLDEMMDLFDNEEVYDMVAFCIRCEFLGEKFVSDHNLQLIDWFAEDDFEDIEK